MVARIASFVLAALCPLLVVTPPAGAQEVPLRNEQEKTLYALGLLLARNLEGYALNRREFPFVVAGLADGVLDREPKVELRDYEQRITQLARARVAAAEVEAASQFVAGAAREKGAITTPSGLVFRELHAGTGPSPGPDSTVRVHYHGTLRDGRVFDSTRSMAPARFPLKGVIPCWQEALQRMRVGGKARIVCPAELAYGSRGAPPNIAPGAALSFEVELIEVVD